MPPRPRLPLPSLASVALPAPRVAVPDSLRGFATDAREARVRHTYGRGYRDLVRGHRGDFSPAPDLVATPREESEIERCLAWATREGVAVVPYGGGTSVVGGVEAGPSDRRAAVLCLSLEAMNAVLSIDPTNRLATAQAGILGPDLERSLGAEGFTLRHYPQSFEFSTLGGWVATRAGGHFATLWTHIDDRLHSVRMLTPKGPWQCGAVPASGAGPDPARWVLGSEGALGVITEATVRVLPRPRFRRSAGLRFEAFEGAVNAARAIAQSGMFPANCRVLDPGEALLNRVHFADGGAVLLLGFESADHPQEVEVARCVELAVGCGASCPEGIRRRDDVDAPRDAAGQQWRDAFLDGPYLQSALVSLGVLVDTFETCCTWSAFPALHADVVRSVEDALRAQCGSGRVTCRFTHVYPDGPAPYFTFLGPATPGRELEQWEHVKRSASEALLRHGATITHHHAVGRTHRPWYDRERPSLFADALRAAKRSLDPAGVMNPGVLIDS